MALKVLFGGGSVSLIFAAGCVLPAGHGTLKM